MIRKVLFYTLRFPNDEVRYDFLYFICRALLSSYLLCGICFEGVTDRWKGLSDSLYILDGKKLVRVGMNSKI